MVAERTLDVETCRCCRGAAKREMVAENLDVMICEISRAQL